MHSARKITTFWRNLLIAAQTERLRWTQYISLNIHMQEDIGFNKNIRSAYEELHN